MKRCGISRLLFKQILTIFSVDGDEIDDERMKIIEPGNSIGTSANSLHLVQLPENALQIVDKHTKKSKNDLISTIGNAQDDGNLNTSRDEQDIEITVKKVHQINTHKHLNTQ